MNSTNTSTNAQTQIQPDEAVPDCLVTRTPFHLEDDWEFVTENTNTSCSHAEIETLIQKRIINLVDLEIMKVLAAYHYINHRNLLMALRSRLHPGYHKDSYLDNIRKLKKAGIVLSYCPVHREDMALSRTATPVSPVRLYCLSQSAHTYMEHVTSGAHPMLPISAGRKIGMAAANQFLIHFETHYGEMIAGMEYQKGTKLGNTPFLLDAIIRYHTVFPGQQEQSLVTLLLLSFRKHRDWEKDALSRLQLLAIWLSRHGAECRIPMPILLVEDIAMAVTLYAKIHAAESLSGLSLYFCPDSLLMLYPPLQAIYRCEAGEDGKVMAVRIIPEKT